MKDILDDYWVDSHCYFYCNDHGNLVPVEGMTCNHCKSSVEQVLESVEGVTSFQVDLDHKKVAYNGNAKVDIIINAIEGRGYTCSL